MNIDSSSDEQFGSFRVESVTSLSLSSGYEDHLKKFHNTGATDHDMEVSIPSSPFSPTPWTPPSSMTTPEHQFNDSGLAFYPSYPDRLFQYTTTPANTRLFGHKDFDALPSASCFLDLSGINLNEASSSKAEQFGGQSPQDRLLSPFDYDAGTNIAVGPALGPHRHPKSWKNSYPMRTHGLPLCVTAEDPDDEKSPGAMRNSRIEGPSHVFSGNRVKSRSKHAKEKEAVLQRRRIAIAKPRNLATNASTSRSGSISQQIRSHDGPSMQYSQTSPTASMTQGGFNNPNTQSIIDDRWPPRHNVKAHGLTKHDFATFRNLEEGNVSGGVFVNSSAPVIVNNGVSPRQLPLDKDCNCVAGATDIHPTHELSSTIPTPESSNSEHSEYEIYFKYLSVKKRGFPLWKPGPHLRLPPEYRKSGVSHGDVGVLNSTTGAFTFLFNIFLPADHEINRWGGVPNGFTPLNKAKAQKTMEVTRLSDRCLKSSSVRRTNNDSFNSTFVFQTTDKDGAVLVMPDGGLSEDMQNYKVIENYIAANAESWGKYVESEDCGVPTENGIQVVVGTDKVPAWGMATFENVESPMQFEFTTHWTASQTRTSNWKRIDGRVGPEEEEIRDLLIGPTTSLNLLCNQCVFVRTLNVSVFSTVRDKSAMAVCSSCSRRYLSGSTLNQADPRRGNVEIQTSQVGSSILHPLKSLNKYLVENHPNARVIITRDSVWMSIINDNDTTLPSVEEICKRVLASHLICEEEGVITLEKREKVVQMNTLYPSTIATATHERTTSEYLQIKDATQALVLANPGHRSFPGSSGALANSKIDVSSLRAHFDNPDPSSGANSDHDKSHSEMDFNPYSQGSTLLSPVLFGSSPSTTLFGPSTIFIASSHSTNLSRSSPSETTMVSSDDIWKLYLETFKSPEHPSSIQALVRGFKKSVGSLRTVRASLMKRKDEGKFTCPIDGCDSTFTRKQNLKYHTQSHLGIKGYQCLCDKALSTPSGLKRHQKTCRRYLKSVAERVDSTSLI